jgi:ABC-2 type transport system ATP-binding protein
MTNMKIIEVENLTKVYGKGLVAAVDHISFEVDQGQVVGLLGRNGAGKTTTVRMLTTLTKPTSGRAEIGGFDITEQPSQVRKMVGIVPQNLSVEDDLTGMENLMLQSKLYHVDTRVAKQRAKELLELVDLTPSGDKDVETYSGGMRKRLEIACAIMGDPKVLFLDEPTLGLDVQSRANIWDYLKMLSRERSLTLFLTTHYMMEADSLCDKILVMNKGRIAIQGTPESLKSSLGQMLYELKVDSTADSAIYLRSLPKVLNVERLEGLSFRVTVACSEDELQPFMSELQKGGLKIAGVDSKSPTLDDVFLHYTGITLSEGSEGETVERLFRMRRLQKE